MKHTNTESTDLIQFIQLVKSIDDTPSLIRRIADNKQYLLFCAAAVKSVHGKNKRLARLHQSLKNQARQQKIPYKQLQEKLQPVAFSLGLFDSGSESIQEDYYKILGVTPETSPDAIKKAYWDAARRSHPDKNSGNEEKFIKIQNAYQTLSDVCLREQYDTSRVKTSGFWKEDTVAKNGDPMPIVYSRYGLFFAGIIVFLFFITILIDQNFNESILTDGYAVDNSKDSGKLINESPETSERKQLPPALKKKMSHEAIGFKKSQNNQYLTEKVPLRTEVPSNLLNNKSLAAQTNIDSFKVSDSKKNGPGKNTSEIAKPLRLKENVLSNESIPSESGKDPDGNLLAVKVPIKQKKRQVQIKNTIRKPVSEMQVENTKPAGVFTPFDSENMIAQLSAFLAKYCQVYTNKDLDKFMNFFTENAKENGRPIKNLFPQYRKNFNTVDLIDYRIDLSGYECDLANNKVFVKGFFYLKWIQFKTGGWRRYQGQVQMELIPDNLTYRIDGLSYQFSKSQKN